MAESRNLPLALQSTNPYAILSDQPSLTDQPSLKVWVVGCDTSYSVHAQMAKGVFVLPRSLPGKNPHGIFRSRQLKEDQATKIKVQQISDRDKIGSDI